MAKVIAQMMFNPFMLRFLEQYPTWFPQCTHTCQEILPMFRRLNSNDPSVDPVEGMNLFLDSFKHPGDAKRLKERDITLFAEERCEILQHLMINTIWTPNLAKHAREAIWQFLIGAYLIAEIKVRVPPLAVEYLEGMMSRHFKHLTEQQQQQRPQQHSTTAPSAENKSHQQQLDKARFRTDAKQVVASFSAADRQQLIDYMIEFLTSDYTPIFGLIPNQYVPLVRNLINRCKTEDGRLTIYQRLQPLFGTVQNKLGVEAEVGELLNDPTLETLASEEEEDAEQRAVIIDKVLNVVTEALARNYHLLRDAAQNPQNITSLVTGTVLNALVGLGEEEEQEDPQAALEHKKKQEEAKTRRLNAELKWGEHGLAADDDDDGDDHHERGDDEKGELCEAHEEYTDYYDDDPQYADTATEYADVDCSVIDS